MRTPLAFALILSLLTSCDDTVIKPATLRLKSVTTYFQAQSGNFRPGDRSLYSYNESGQLTTKEYQTYDVTTDAFNTFSTSTFTYSSNKLLTQISEQVSTLAPKVTTFTYTNGNLSKIFLDDDLDTEATIDYLPGDTIKVRYAISNGRWFDYRFRRSSENISLEQTFTESGELASEVTHEYDGGLNPYSLLGYTDLFFRNYSVNNKVKTESEYFASAFPQSVPVSYEYVYNEKNLPIEQVTTYKSYPNGTSTLLMKTIFEYE